MSSSGHTTDSFVYVRCQEQHWVPARVVDKKEQTATVLVADHKKKKQVRKTVNLSDYPNDVLPLQNVDSTGRLEVYEDMKDVPFLTEASILYNLKARLRQEKPYTKTGSIVIAVNPYQWYPALYSAETQKCYADHILSNKNHTPQPDNSSDNKQQQPLLEPHVYETSGEAYKGLLLGTNQSILVSGESGAGKTETVKIAMNHIAMMGSGTNRSQTVQRVIDSNRLMEAFGNAATRRNDNSSRFGKYLQLQFALGEKPLQSFYQATDSTQWRDCQLVGSQTEVYLLEKSRVVHHEEQERSFHIFYQLLAAPDKVKGQFWKQLCGKNAVSFKYLSGSGASATTTMIEGKSDAQHFQETVSTLALVGVTQDKLQTLMRAVSAVLQLGNIDFTGCADQSNVASADELRHLADLLGVSASTLSVAFTQRTIVTAGETVSTHLNTVAAQESCDALAKAIYEAAFLWLVKEINQATSASTAGASSTSFSQNGIIGLLDIFGFESFEQNGFEQLCINYANEKLQQKFTEDIFRQVQAEYESEGLAAIDICYDDNSDVLDLIESRLGLLAMLNEECVRPSGSDKEFVYKATKENAKSSALITDKCFTPLQFGIRHYAGSVVYTADGFLQKNNDTLAADLMQCAGQSTNSIVASVLVQQPPSKKTIRRRGSSLNGSTVWTKYKTGLQSLMTELHTTQSQYIRCIKPNEKKMPAVMEHGPTLDQLRSAGVIAAITLTRSAFPNRLDHDSVLSRFRHLVRGEEENEDSSQKLSIRVKNLLKPLLMHLTTNSEDGRVIKAFAVGNTRTYFRAGALEYLEALRIKGFEPAAVSIQKTARGFLVRKNMRNAYIEHREAAIKIQSRARVVLSKVKMQRAKEDKMMRELRERAATTINKIARAVVRRIKFREELRRYRHVTAMKNELARLQIQVEESERQKIQAVKAAEEKVRQALTTLKEEESRSSSNSVDSETAKLLQQKNALIEKMRSDNKRVRANIKMLEAKHKRLREEGQKMKAENGKVTDEFLQKNDEAKAMMAENEKAVQNQEALKKQVLAMTEELKRNHGVVVESANTRVKFQETMADIIKILRTQCRDEQLIEDSIFIALDSDTEAKGIKAGFDALQASRTENGKGQVVSTVPESVGGEGDHSHTGATDDSTSQGSISDEDYLPYDEDDLDREEREMEAELQALELELGA